MTTPVVRYVPHGNNALLKQALLEAWKNLCYWHREPLRFHHAEIDHVIPQALARKPEVLAANQLPRDFDVHDPANLAPICGSCNREKGSIDYTDSPIVLRRMKQASDLRQDVIDYVVAASSDQEVARHAVTLSTAPLESAPDREAFVRHAPAILQRLVDLAPDAVQFRTGLVVISPESDDWHDAGGRDELGRARTIAASLDNQARRTQVILEDVCGVDLTAMLEEAAAAITSALCKDHESWVDGWTSERHPDPLTSGQAGADSLDVAFDAISFEREDDTYEFTFGAEVDAVLVASATRSDSHGDGLEDVQAEARVNGRVAVRASWAFGDPRGKMDFGDVDTSATTADRWIE